MAFGLYDATIPSYLQILRALRGIVVKAEEHCAAGDASEADLLALHFGADMLPLPWQIKWASTHSIGAIEALRVGAFEPDRDPPADSLAALRAQLDQSIAALEKITREEVEALIGRDMRFSVPARGLVMDFLAEDFLLSFSMPNFYFHVTTAYDLLRNAGLALGKFDYMGMPRLKPPVPA